MMATIQEIIHQNRVGYCLDCGKCSAVCPITRWGVYGYASPRLLVEKAIMGQMESVLEDKLFWSCLTCKRCSEICPSDVSFSEFIRDLRSLGQQQNRSGSCTHNGVIQTWAEMMTDPGLLQNRLGWLTNDLHISTHSDTVYFVGCLPYYDAMFEHLGFEGVQIAQSGIRIMNYLGIEPMVLSDERCCGHDQLWQGKRETFLSLAQLNLDQLKKTGARRIVTTCPECTRTLKIDYPRWVGEHGMEVLHIAELLAQEKDSLPINTSNHDQGKTRIMADHPVVTFQDPCRLGRHLGAYDAPRKVIERLGLQVTEMAHTRQNSLCCGTSCWTSCGATNKNIQMERLVEAKATGADLLVTACPKCQIHFKCAQSDPNLGEINFLQMRDLTTLVAERLPQHRRC